MILKHFFLFGGWHKKNKNFFFVWWSKFRLFLNQTSNSTHYTTLGQREKLVLCAKYVTKTIGNGFQNRFLIIGIKTAIPTNLRERKNHFVCAKSVTQTEGFSINIFFASFERVYIKTANLTKLGREKSFFVMCKICGQNRFLQFV